MIKKFKRWYESLLEYQKSELLSEIVPLLILVILIVLDLLEFIPFLFYSGLRGDWLGFGFDFCIFVMIILPIYSMLEGSASHAKFSYELENNYKKLKEYFDKSRSNIIEIIPIPKYLSNISDIIEYFHKKDKIIESFWVELNYDDNKKPIYYLYVTLKNESERIIYPEKITNPNFFLSNFTFKI